MAQQSEPSRKTTASVTAENVIAYLETFGPDGKTKAK